VYPLTKYVRLAHLITLDVLNITFSALNHYSIGVWLHSSLGLLHVSLLVSDFIIIYLNRNSKTKRKKCNCCKTSLKKYSSKLFNIMYYLCAYLSLMCFLLMCSSYVRGLHIIFSDCSLSDQCRKIGPLNRDDHHHFNVPVGFIVSDTSLIEREIRDWLQT
jgi:hypothetical protein